jgi:tetratricopeptide (TPR) repeat protein
MKVLEYARRFRLYLLIAGGVCLAFGIYEKVWYSDQIGKAVETIDENRLDQQHLEKARNVVIRSDELISYNMGVRAYRASNLKKASEYFYEVIHKSKSAYWRKRAYYNLGNILVQLDLPRKAAEMYRECLRLDPTDWESKYNLERLYVFYPMAFPDESEKASLDQEPGDEKGDQNQIGKYGAQEPDL